MTIEVYTFEDADGAEPGCYTTHDINEAREYAQKYRLRIIANEYEWSDSYMIEDHCPKRNRRKSATQ